MIEWTCHGLLERAGDRRRAEWLARAHEALQAQAAAIADAPLREKFLGSIPLHREILAAWAAGKAVSADR